ncbi:MAG: hypothetical protein JNJ77_15345 [Planctomycetia bacterium]|nr:hypothetical protein [Planctomycetia bacterium]
MIRRILFTCLAALTFSGFMVAGEFKDKENHLSANFPGTVKTVRDKQPHVQMTLHVSSSEGVVFVAGSMTAAAEKAQPEQLKEMVIPYLEGVDEKLKNMKVIKQGDTKLNDQSPAGYWFLVQHDGGFQLHWITVENGKLYMVTVSARDENTIRSKMVKKFLDSVKIKQEINAQ